ncbi:hypothetical protein ES707_18206 [subsurface metagenome]
MTNTKKPSVIVAGMKFFLVEDIAKMLNLKEHTIRYYLREKKLKGFRLGQRWYISNANLKAFLGGGRFFDQPDDIIMDKINEAIKSTFESNVPWLANEVKKLITKDLIGVISEKFKQIAENNKQFSGRIAEHFRNREKGTKKEFEKVK